MIVRTEPEPLAQVSDLDQEVRFHFDERISEQLAGGALEDAVTVSPQGGEVSVSHGSRSLTIRIDGGLREGVVYRVTLLPVVRDLFGNQLVDPFELVFSTGAEPTPTTLAGQVWDRISGQGVAGALVRAVASDSLVHVARADGQGIYAFRYVPSGAFVVTGFEDADRDGEAGDREVKGSRAATLAAGDTLLLDVPVLGPDTTAAVLGLATALDSVTVVLEHDDYLDPSAAASEVVVELSGTDGQAPGVSRLFHEHEYRAYVEAVTDSLASAASPLPTVSPAPDTLTAGPSVPDTAARDAPAPDTSALGRGRGRGGGPAATATRAGPPQLPGGRGAGAPAASVGPGRTLPGRRLVAVLDGPLEVGPEYRVLVGSVVNLNGLPGGGGEATLLLEAAAADAGGDVDAPAVPDSAQAPDSTGGAPQEPDTVRVPGPAAGDGGARR